MGTTDRQVVPEGNGLASCILLVEAPVTSEVVLGEVLWAGRVEVENLLEVEELDTVLDGLGANDNNVANDTDLAPVGANAVILGESAEVDKFALLADLCKGGAVVLANGNELTPVGRGPTPGG
jgi:hypothetical protein